MNRQSRTALFVFIFFLSLFIPKLSAQQELPFENPLATISMDFQDASLKDILKIFSVQSGLNFIASEGVQDRKITLYLDKVAIKQAMDKIFKANNLSYELDKTSSIFIVKDWGKPQIETLTKVFYLKYATVSTSSMKQEMSDNLIGTAQQQSAAGTSSTSGVGTGGEEDKGKWKVEEDAGITQAVKKVLSEYGSVLEDFRTNSLIVTDIPSRFSVIEKVIAALDIPVPQVMLEVEMLDVSKNVVDKIGFDFSNAGSFAMQIVSASTRTAFPLYSQVPLGGLAKNFTAGTLSFPTNIKGVIDFLSTQTDTKYLARPRLLTLNNETAEIRISTNESIGIKTVTMAAQQTATQAVEPERATTGVTLRITPQINTESGEITMFLYPKVADTTAGNTFTVNNANYQYRDPEERSTKSVVKLKDGDTVIIGGLLRNEYTNVNTKIPFLGDIPILGTFFRHNYKSKDKKRELLVFITPRIVKDTGIELAKAPKKTNILFPREQGTAKAADERQARINASLDLLEKKKK
jgi:type II secretory pathway component GspD/PulD (secretin)